jgi:ABC-2 type transport system permease protein
MSTLIYAARDSTTMLRRDIRHAVRFPMATLSGVMVPVIFLLLFAGVFGHTFRAGLAAAIPAGGSYIDYLVPGIILMTACSTAEMTALNVSTDMTEGIIARFRTMAITRTSVLIGQVLGGLIRAMISAVLVIAVALALGFRSSASATDWIKAAALYALLAIAVTWLTVSFGLLAKTPAGANSLSLIVVMAPFISSAFVPSATMPAGIAWFAHNQPFTPIIQTLRGLLTGTPMGNDAILAITWCVAIGVFGYLWASSLYNRNRAQS